MVINCRTSEEADKLIDILHNEGYKWSSGRTYLDHTHRWNIYQEETCYEPYSGYYGRLDYYEAEGYEIFNFSDLTIDSKYLSNRTIKKEYNK